MSDRNTVPKFTTDEFLHAIIPSGYRICLSSIRTHPNPGRAKKPFSNEFFGAGANGAITKRLELATAHDDTNWYFGLAGYGDADARTAENAKAMRVLVIDADTKAKAGCFTTKDEILQALHALRLAVPELPPAWLVDSGHGYHVYYAFDNPVTITDWLPVANLFIRVARAVDPRLMVDSQCSRDAARVLRLPGSFNAKQEQRLPVTLFQQGGFAPFATIKDALTRAAAALNVPASAEVLGDGLFTGSARAPAFMQAPATDVAFGKGLDGRIGDLFVDLPLRPILEGCKQMRDMVVARGDVPYDQWLLMLRVINTTKNPDEAACRASNGHPTYSKGETLRKMHEIQTKFGAVTAGCREFDACNPAGCVACPHKATIWTPSQLALQELQQKEVAHATAEARESAEQGIITPKGYLTQPSTVKQVLAHGTQEVTSLPVKRGKASLAHEPMFNAHLHIKGASDQLDSVVVNHVDTHRTSDRFVHLDVALNGRTNSVAIPSGTLTADSFSLATAPLRDMGVTFERDPISKGVILGYLSELNRLASHKMTYYRPVKGWRKVGRCGNWDFVAGARTFHPDGSTTDDYTVAEHRGLASDCMGFMERVCPGMPTGRINLWQQGMDMYTGRNMGVAQILLLSGLSNLLLPLLSADKGGILLTLTGESGKGKTTLLKFLASFTGPYDRYLVPGDSTENALGMMLKEANCMMLPVDDTIQQNAQAFSTLLTLVSGGAEKLRMRWDSQAGGSIPFQEGFNASLILTSNYSSSSLIGTGTKYERQMVAEAARSRTLEIPTGLINVTQRTEAEWRNALHIIAGNYGHAVAAFLQCVVTNQVVVRTKLEKAEQFFLDRLQVGIQPDKKALVRFWARWLAVSAVTARLVCNKLNLLPWSAEAIVEAGLELAKDATSKAHEADVDLVEAFWNSFRDESDSWTGVNRQHWQGSYPAGWNWIRDRALFRRTMVAWKAGAPMQDGQPADTDRYRALLETIDLYDETVTPAKPMMRERTVYIQLNELKNHVHALKGHALPVSDWADLYTRLLSVGCVVRGVLPGSPNNLDPTNRCQMDLQERPTTAPQYRVNVVEIRLPPIAL